MIGDWGLGIGDWGLGPIPNPLSHSKCLTIQYIILEIDVIKSNYNISKIH
jgi:hypothetical protein